MMTDQQSEDRSTKVKVYYIIYIYWTRYTHIYFLFFYQYDKLASFANPRKMWESFQVFSL